MVRFTSLAAAGLMAMVPSIMAHGSDDQPELVAREMEQRNEQHAMAARAVGTCENSAGAKAARSRAIARRANKARELRAERGLTASSMGHQKRDLANLEKYINMDHNRTGTVDYDENTPADVIFGSKNQAALVPETTVGPYWVTGEYNRQDITDGEAGVPLHLEMQFIDVNTCEPLPNIVVDAWHCNSTGFYSGLGDTMLGEEGALDTTFMRGFQITDNDGVAAFDTAFPGHYQGRVTHFHIIAGTEYTIFPNSTYSAGRTLHIGQVYFDDALVKSVEALAPYNTNNISYTTWENDGWMLDEALADYDPIAEYVQLGSGLEDGLLGWITVGIDTTADHSKNATPAVNFYEGGGVTATGSGPGAPPTGSPPPMKLF